MQPMQGSTAAAQQCARPMLPVAALRAGPPAQVLQAAVSPIMTPLDVPTTHWRTALGASPLAAATPAGATTGWRSNVCPNAPRKREAQPAYSPTGSVGSWPMSPIDVWPSPQASPMASCLGSPMNGVFMAPEPYRCFGRLPLDSPMVSSLSSGVSRPANTSPMAASSPLNDAFLCSPTHSLGGSPVGAMSVTSGAAPEASPFFIDATPIAMLPENSPFGASFAPFQHRPRAKTDVEDPRRPLGPANWVRQLGA
eukprot:TRINITY_DN34345_c0_g1_i1.p1 TRINITY_DN34345_c0_g1~~TRINITY_DN34345_c0_g1_i1.p1  ORF type:complete len:272 (-),score=32.30 TRINITY_DN34345_c0_g1_i1:93-851(-)